MISALQHKSKLNFDLLKKKKIWGFGATVGTRKDLSIDVAYQLPM